MKRVIVVGAGGHAKIIVDMLQQNGEYEVTGLVDNAAENGFWNIPILGKDDDLVNIYQEMGIKYAFVALGNGKLREKVTARVLSAGFKLINVISKHSVISPRTLLGVGNAIMPGSIINADVKIGNGCIINTNASIDHDGNIGDYTHVAPGSVVCGGVKIGSQCLLGAGCRVIDCMVIGNNTLIGAGAAVVVNIEGNCTVVGVPARIIKKNNIVEDKNE